MQKITCCRFGSWAARFEISWLSQCGVFHGGLLAPKRASEGILVALSIPGQKSWHVAQAQALAQPEKKDGARESALKGLVVSSGGETGVAQP